MVFTFLAAQGYEVGTSLLESDQIDTVKGYLNDAAAGGKQIVLPSDIVVAPEFKADAAADGRRGRRHAGRPDRPGHRAGVRPGVRLGDQLGQDGVLERSDGGRRVGELRRRHEGGGAALTEVDGLSVVGGGDSAAAVRDLGFADDAFGHISTGGGASLEYLEGKTLPGLAVLDEEH